MSERFYRLPRGQETFETGTASGRLVLLGPTLHDVVLHWFDRDGRFLGLERIPLDAAPDLVPGTSSHRTGEDYGRRARSAIEAVKARVGFLPADILVRMFDSDEAGIVDLPGHREEFLRAPEAFGEEDRDSMRSALDEWRERGCFVLWWHEEYWIDGSGDVLST